MNEDIKFKDCRFVWIIKWNWEMKWFNSNYKNMDENQPLLNKISKSNGSITQSNESINIENHASETNSK